MGTMTPEDLDAIEKRITAATPGPWTASHRNVGMTADQDESIGLGLEIGWPREAWTRGQFARGADATFIAHSRTDIPALLAEVRRLTAENAYQTARADTWRNRAEAVALPADEIVAAGEEATAGLYCSQEFLEPLGQAATVVLKAIRAELKVEAASRDVGTATGG